ncbi:hypothetical protein [Micromonospora sp. NPDC005652]|uniref:hypothetical protein n=1 Tax=Micromonospora sp. NPDC005652 TaxID=3157046 RepID=UPI0033FFDF07
MTTQPTTGTDLVARTDVIKGTLGQGKNLTVAFPIGRHLDGSEATLEITGDGKSLHGVLARSLPPVPLEAWAPASRAETERILRDAQRAMARRNRARRRFDWGTAAMLGIVLGAVVAALAVVLAEGPDMRVGAIAGVAVVVVSVWGRMRAHAAPHTTTDKRP